MGNFWHLLKLSLAGDLAAEPQVPIFSGFNRLSGEYEKSHSGTPYFDEDIVIPATATMSGNRCSSVTKNGRIFE